MKGQILMEHALALCLAVVAPLANFLAEVTIPELPQWAGNLPATAILGWYAWHTTTKTIPEMVRDHREDIKQEREQRQRQHEEHIEILRQLKEGLSRP